MTKREIVLAAIQQQDTGGKIPCDFQATETVLERLYKHYGAKTYRELLDCLGSYIVDIRGVVDPIWVADHPKQQLLENGVVQNFLGWQMQDQDTVHGKMREHCGYILSECDSIEEMEKFNWMKTEWFDFSNIEADLEEYEGLAVMVSGASVYTHAGLIRGMEPLMCDMVVEPELAHYILDKYVDFYVEYFDKLFAAANGRIDILRMTDDLGMQDRLLISEELFLKYMTGNIKKLCDVAHKHGVKVLFHSCGAIEPLIPHIINTTADILDPLQPAAKGMQPEVIAEKYLGKICLHGGVDTQYTLPQGSPKDVENEVLERIKVYGKSKTGYIIAPSHSLQPDVSVENIVAMYDTIKRHNGE